MSLDRDALALYDRIRFDRADGRCECEGECGKSHQTGIHHRCPNMHGRSAVHGSDKAVSLTVRHLDGDKRDTAEGNLLAMCQTCIGRHRALVRTQSKRRSERESIEAMHEPMFDVEALITSATPGAHL